MWTSKKVTIDFQICVFSSINKSWYFSSKVHKYSI